MKKNDLNKLAARLSDRHLEFEHSDNRLSATFFSWELRIEQFADGYTLLSVQQGRATLLLTADGKSVLSQAALVTVIKDFRRRHPLTIWRFGRGRFQVLDPEGYDFCGEYVSLTDARRTTGRFYQME